MSPTPQVLAAFASVAENSEQDFVKYYDHIVPFLKQLLARPGPLPPSLGIGGTWLGNRRGGRASMQPRWAIPSDWGDWVAVD